MVLLRYLAGPPVPEVPGCAESPSGRPRLSSDDMFGSNLYYVSFLGTPSTTYPWMLQSGGHHLALNITIAGRQGVLTQTLTGAQPATFKLNGKTIRPPGRELEAIWLRTIAFRVRTSLLNTHRRTTSPPTTCIQSIAIRRMTPDVRWRSIEMEYHSRNRRMCSSHWKAASAHRIDEHLQAAVLSLEANRVQASMRLILGMDIRANSQCRDSRRHDR
jgi:Protein of unknown function (DUF3500)